MRVVVTGGGTGGHIYPALAVAEQLHTDGAELRYVGGTSGPEVDIVPPTGIPFHAVTARKLRKLASPSTVGVLFALMKGYRQAAGLLREFRPDVVISTGGYVASATAIAAARQRIPLVTQACDAVPGRTNLWLSRWASRICIWFEETADVLPRGKTAVTGVPIRADVVSKTTPGEARRSLDLDPQAFTVLVLGGSQGARRLNEILLDALPRISSGAQVLHQTGARNQDSVVASARERDLSRICYQPRAYLGPAEVPLAYRAADLVICRCGISTLAEVTANGIPALMVPLPTAYADHQTHNARAVERRGAGILLPEPALLPQVLADHVQVIRSDPARRQAMSGAGRALGKPNAAERVAELARELTVDDRR